MQLIETELPGVLLFKPDIFEDDRGYLYEAYKADYFKGLNIDFVQDNVSVSKQNVLRGLHFQNKRPQGKLIQVLEGEIIDVAVDVRPNSKYFGKYFAATIDSIRHHQIWIPPGFAHGFYVLSAKAIVHYKCTDYYDSNDQAGIAWDCPVVNIKWPIKNRPLLSAKDALLPSLNNLG